MTDAGIDREAHERLCGIVRREGKERWSARFPGDPQAVALREKEAEGELAAIGRVGMSRALFAATALRDLAEERGVPAICWTGRSTGSLVLDAFGLNPLDPLGAGLMWELIYLRERALDLTVVVGATRVDALVRGLAERCSGSSFEIAELRRFRDDFGFDLRRDSRWRNDPASFRSGIVIARDPTLARIRAAHGGRLPRLDDPALRDPAVFEALAGGRTKRTRMLGGRRGVEALRRIAPTDAAEVAAAFALCQPYPFEHWIIEAYVDGKGAAPAGGLRGEVTDETRGVILYREQAIRLLARAGCTSVEEAYRAYRAFMGTGKDFPTIRKVIDAGRARGVPDGEVDAILRSVTNNAGWLGPKDHACGATWMLLAEEMGSVRT